MQGWEASVTSAQQGSLEAFDALVGRFQHMAVGYAYSVLRDFHLAEDAAQEAFLQAYQDLGTLREPRAFPSWLRRLVFKHCDRITRRKRLPMVALDEAAEVPDPGADPLAALERRQARQSVLAAVEALPDGERSATALFYINGYSLAEVSDFLEVPVGTVKRRLHSARSHLRERMVPLVEETLKQHAPDEQFTRRVRQALEGVPRIGYEIHCCPLPGALVACMEYLRDPADYDTLMGVTGAAFRRLWERDDCGSVDLMYFQPEPHTRAFRALGYECRTVPHDRKAMLEAIRESIGRGVPVLSFGILGPPEAGIVAGYGEDGEVLYGYSYFQDRSVAGYYEKTDWFETMVRGCPLGLIVIGGKTSKPSEREVLVSTLEWALRLAHAPTLGALMGTPDGHLCGLAAYEGWARGLEVDADYPPDDPQVMDARVMVHGDQCTMLWERTYGASYLRGAAAAAPEAAEALNAAAELYTQVAGRGTAVWPWGHSRGPDTQRGLADRATRREIARQVRLAAQEEARAVGHLEKALALLKG